MVAPYAMSSTAGSGNPFLKMVDQPYASYMMEMKDIRYRMDYVWSREKADSIVRYIHEAVAAAGNERWRLEERLLLLSYRFHYEKPGAAQEVIDSLQAICRDAEQAKDTLMTLRTGYDLLYANWHVCRAYEASFEQAKKMMKEMESISAEVLPEKLFFFRLLGDMHYRFGDYEEAKIYYTKIADEPAIAADYHLLQSAYNGLALVARYHNSDLPASNRYLHLILSLPEHPTASRGHTDSWEGIAHGNLGYNHYLNKQYKEAIIELEFARKRMVEQNDYTFAGKMAVTLADVHLALGNKATCKQYLDQAESYNRQVGNHKRQTNLYPVLCKYYLSIGNTKLGEQYMDSVIASQKQAGEEFNMLKLMRAEQRNHKLEQQAKEEELKNELQRGAHYRQTIAAIGVVVLLVALFAAILVVLLIKKRKTYRMLARKNRELATSIKAYEREPETTPDEDAQPIELLPDAETLLRESALLDRIRQAMEKQKLYTQVDLTLTSLADALQEKRQTVSSAINHCAGTTVTQFINDYRVNEAIRILSDPGKAKLTVDRLAVRVGFNDRKSFYRTFKKNTGLSPSEFKQNIREKE